MKKILSNKFIAYILIPLVLVLFWLISSLLFNKQISFSVLEYGENNPPQSVSGKLLKGEKISGNFIAKENNLGIIIVRFNRYVKPDYRGEDVLSFKLKENNAKDWYYFNNYRSGLVESQLLFPFGFPVIDNSKGKEYHFEIESLFGNATNALEISKDMPVLITAYQIPRNEITGSKLRLISFIFKKTLNSLASFDFLLSSIIFLLPLLFYVLWKFILKKSALSRKIFSFAVILLIFFDIFLIKEVYIGILLGLIIGLIYAIKSNRFKSYFTFKWVVFLIFFWAILIYLNISNFSNKLNIWVFTFLVIGVGQMLLEEKRNK